MNHLEEFNVAFTGITPRKFEGNSYNRVNFRIKGKRYSVNCGDANPSGQCGVVMFVKAGEQNADGTGVVHKDSFSLIEVTSAEAVTNAETALEALNALGA